MLQSEVMYGVVIDADADTTGVRADVVDPIRNRLAQLLVDEVMHVDLVGTAFATIVAARVLVRADAFLFLGVDRDHRLAGRLKGFDLRVDMLELGVPVDMMTAFQALAVDLTAVSEAIEPLRNSARGNPMAPFPQRLRELRTQRSGRIGSPSVVDASSARKSSNSVGSVCVSAGRPPPERRTFEGAGSRACKSFRPRLIVLRATPVARATMVTPPYPAVRASAAQNNRLPRSSRRRRNASKRLRIAVSSIMPT